MCGPFEDRHIVQLMGLVLVVGAATSFAINSAAGPGIIGPTHHGGLPIENIRLLCGRQIPKLFQKGLELHMTKKIMLKEVFHHQPVPRGVNQNISSIPIEVPHGLCLNHFLGLSKKGTCGPKREKNHPLPRKNVWSGDCIPLTLLLPCGSNGVDRELGFRVLGEDPSGVVGDGVGETNHPLPLPLTKLDSCLLHIKHEWVVKLVLPPPTH